MLYNIVMNIGAHVSIGGELSQAIKNGQACGCESIQIFTSNPKGWDFKIRSEKEISDFCENLKNSEIKSVWGHMIYLTNLASNNPYIYTNSINALISGLTLAQRACFSGVITHIGSHGGRGEEEGLKQVVNAVRQALATTEEKIPIILEVDAGPGNHLGAKFEHLAEIIKQVGSPNVKVCLDTCHAFAAGYDLRTQKAIDKTIDEFDRIIGLENLAVLHLNDSKGDLGSHLDRHEIIGQGKIGIEAFRHIVNHPKLKHLTGIVETPDLKGLSDEKHSIDILKNLRKS